MDPRLPSSPDQKYRNSGWVSWAHFLGVDEKEKYSKYHQAKAAVKKLGIRSRKEYYAKKAYIMDSGLTYYPDRKFKNKGWTCWSEFLNFD